MTTDLMVEKAYWDKAAADPDVAEKYIANIPLKPCLDAIMPALKPTSILEIGCGIGRLTTAISEWLPECQVHGIDISSDMLDLAPKSSVKYRQNNGRNIPYAAESFDSVYSMLVFQHVPDIAKEGYIREAYRVLKNNGVFRFQFVEGTHHADIDHNVGEWQVVTWLKKAGFDSWTIERGLIFKNWSWITAVKKGKA